MADSRGTHPSQRRYPPELRDRAVRMVLETFEQTGTRTGVITRIARQLGIGSESLRSWVRQAEVDGGLRSGTSSQEKSASRRWSARSGSCVGPMKSCGRRRLSSRPSSTAGVRGDPLHRCLP
jgi:transposase-like protein